MLDHMYPKTKVTFLIAAFFSFLFLPFLPLLPVTFYFFVRLLVSFFTILHISLPFFPFSPLPPLFHLLSSFFIFFHHLFSIIIQVDLLLVQAEEFSPELVMQLSLDLKIQPSFMFIRCPGVNFPYNIGDFRGVRTIMQ